MSKSTFRTYDIASYEIELEYNKEIAPIKKAIDKLKSSHEAKSNKAHNDFLTKEAKSKAIIAQLQEKSLLRHQRIERAVENKLKKLEPRRRRYDTDMEEYKGEQEALVQTEKDDIQAKIDILKLEEQQAIDEIKTKYKTNIESYVEKLDIYNNNFEGNKTQHYDQVSKYQEEINQRINDVQAFYDDIATTLHTNLESFKQELDAANKTIALSLEETTKSLNNDSTSIRKQSNKDISQVNEYVDTLQDAYDTHFADIQTRINDHITTLKADFEVREQLIETDLNINVEKYKTQLEELPEDAEKNVRRSLERKLDLFELRAATTIRYEQRLFDQQLVLLEREASDFAKQSQFEQDNLEKLRVFLVNDETSLKDTNDYYKDVNLELREQLNSFVLINHEYMYRHQDLKTDFMEEYTRIFKELKFSTIELAQSYLEQMAENNREMDEINKFIDTAEPLREIEVNRLRENIEINEVKERYKIKYAQQENELARLDAKTQYDFTLADINNKEQLSEFNMDVAEIQFNEIYDKAVETAKLKHRRAEQVFNLRINSTNLERRLAKSKYKTEQGIAERRKELVGYEVRQSNALQLRELDYTIDHHEIEAKYKVEVIQKRLEEDLMKLNEEYAKAKLEYDAYQANMDVAIEQKRLEIKQRHFDVEQQFADQLGMIDTALEREIRQPTKGKLKTEAIIDERLSKFDLNNKIFADYITHAISSFTDDRLSLDQTQDIIVKTDTITDKSMKYLERAYQVLRDGVIFMNQIEERNILNNISATSDQGKIKKLTKTLDKLKIEQTKTLDLVHQQESDHKATVRLLLTKEMEELKAYNPEDVTAMLTITDNLYNKVLAKLNSIQEDVKATVITLYHPLIKQDQELIDYATKNAAIAREKVQQALQDATAPLNTELEDYITSLQQEQSEFHSALEENIASLEAQINHLKAEALEQTNLIQNELKETNQRNETAKAELLASEEQAVVKAIEAIDQELVRLTEEYDSAMTVFTEKDNEAKSIYDYENRIFNIADESATARYNESVLKSKNAHLKNVQQYRMMRDQALQRKDKTERDLQERLIAMTNEFERNIFTVRPRLEESIGDAQKEIDNQIAERQERLDDLEANNARLRSSAETRLFTAYREGTDRLSDNLQQYIEKYRIIEDDYHNQNQDANGLIKLNNDKFSAGLFDLHKAKHQKNLEQLLDINKPMFAKEE